MSKSSILTEGLSCLKYRFLRKLCENRQSLSQLRDRSLYTSEPMTRRGCHYIKKPIHIVSLSYRANEASNKSAKAKKALYDFFRVQTKQKRRQSRLCAAVKSDLSYIFCFYGGNCFFAGKLSIFPTAFCKIRSASETVTSSLPSASQQSDAEESSEILPTAARRVSSASDTVTSPFLSASP